MCKEDIRVARKAYPGRTYGTVVPATGTLIFGANSNRFSLSAAIGYAAPLSRNVSAMLAVKVGNDFVPLIVFSADNQGGRVNLNEIGSLIIGPIHYVTTGVEIPTALYVGETAYIDELEDI